LDSWEDFFRPIRDDREWPKKKPLPVGTGRGESVKRQAPRGAMVTDTTTATAE